MTSKIKFKDIQGEWAIISDNEILTHDPDLSIILKTAEEYDEDKITIRKVIGSQYHFYGTAYFGNV